MQRYQKYFLDHTRLRYIYRLLDQWYIAGYSATFCSI